MRDGLRLRVEVIALLANMRHQLITQVRPGQPTKLLEATQLLKAGLQAISGRLSDPEPSNTTFTDNQLLIAQMKNGQVATRANNLKETIERVDAMLLVDEAGNEVATWTEEQLQKANAHIEAQIQGLKDDIEAL